MKHKIIIWAIASAEVFIGLATAISLLLAPLASAAKKATNIFVFVLVTSLLSIAIGAGLFGCRELARKILLFFSAYIILTKLFVFLNLMYFNGEILTYIPTGIKNGISTLYHGAVILLLTRPAVKEHFNKP